jgi:uncharacterized delta-60 repeat protein
MVAGVMSVALAAGGLVTASITSGNDYGNAGAIDPSTGDLITLGGAAQNRYFGISRHTAGGTLLFTQTTDFGGSASGANSVVVQPDGKILVGGFKVYLKGSSQAVDFALARYQPSGALDPSFGSSGKLTTAFSKTQAVLGALAIQPDGKILASGGTSGGGKALLARYNSSGSLDTSFGSKGMATYSGSAGAPAMALQGTKILIAGWTGTGSGEDAVVARLNSNGSVDTTFGVSGRQVINIGNTGTDRLLNIALRADGTIVAAGLYANGSGTSDYSVVRLTANGALDPSFGGSGVVTLDTGADEYAVGLSVQSDGKVVVGGNTGVAIRLEEDGSLDATFGSAGIASGAGLTAGDIRMTADGSFLLFGYTNGDFSIGKYNASGALDSGF